MNPWRSLSGLPRSLWILSGAALVNRAGQMVLPFLVLYFTKYLGLSDARAGALLALYGGVSLVASPLGGRLADRFGSINVMCLSLAMSSTTMLAFPLAKSFGAVALVTLTLSATSEIFRPANLALLAELAPPDRRKPAFALHRLAVNLGMSIGPAVGGVLAGLWYPSLFVVDGLTSMASLVILFTVLRRSHTPSRPADPPVESTDPPGTARGGLRSALGALSDRRFLYFACAMLPSGLVFFQTQGPLQLFAARSLSLPESLIGLVLTINTVMIVLFEIPLNGAMARWSHGRTLASGALLTAIGFGASALARGPLSLAATVSVWTIGEMLLFPGSSAFVAEIAPPNRRGDYMGMYSMTFGVCFALGPWLGTVVYERLGGNVLWGAMFGLGLISTALMTNVSSASSPPSPASGTLAALEVASPAPSETRGGEE